MEQQKQEKILEQINKPALEPVRLDQVLGHLGIENGKCDDLLNAYISVARQFAESYTHLAFIKQRFRWVFDKWPADAFVNCTQRFVTVPKSPLIEVERILTQTESDDKHVFNPDNYYVSTAQNRIYRRVGVKWPKPKVEARGIEIIFTAGFGTNPDDIPVGLNKALLDLVRFIYEHKVPINNPTTMPVPFTIREVLNLYRRTW